MLGETDPSRLGYYYVEDHEKPGDHLLLVRVFERDDYSNRKGFANAIDGIRADVPRRLLHSKGSASR